MTLLRLSRLIADQGRPVVSRLYSSTVGVDNKDLKSSYDALVIGADVEKELKEILPSSTFSKLISGQPSTSNSNKTSSATPKSSSSQSTSSSKTQKTSSSSPKTTSSSQKSPKKSQSASSSSQSTNNRNPSKEKPKSVNALKVLKQSSTKPKPHNPIPTSNKFAELENMDTVDDVEDDVSALETSIWSSSKDTRNEDIDTCKAAYLQKQGLNVCVLERRHVIGGAAVTEEIIPGYKFSRASYVLSLLRPQVYKDLELKKYGLKVYLRDPNAYTPLLEPQTIRGQEVRSLLLGRDAAKNKTQIAQFSEKDARKFEEFEDMLNRIVSSLDPILDSPPVHLPLLLNHKTLHDKLKLYHSVKNLFQCMVKLGKDSKDFYDLMTAPATKVLDKWFESKPLKATLATDAVIGAMISPETPGSGYVLLHHVMGELEGVKGAWGIVEGGMGSVSQAIANCAMDHGASIFTNKPVNKILTQNDEAVGVVLEDGTEIRSKVILSNATPKVTFVDLLPKKTLPCDIEDDIKLFNYDSPVTKINVAVNMIPNFLADPNTGENTVMPHHRCTIHINCEDTNCITEAYLDAKQGKYSKRPMIEMTIPSSLDPTIAPPGHHVVLLFTQYTPYNLADGQMWDDQTKNAYADTVFDSIEQYAPGFKESVVGRDILTPPDLEAVFGLTGGNIFHGAMSLDQLYMVRPTSALSNYRSPLARLYLCGSGAHPGGGVMGSAGRLAAQTVLEDRKKLKL